MASTMALLVRGGPSNPLVSGVGGLTGWLAAVAEGPQAMTGIVNRTLTNLEAAQAEYTPMQLDVSGLVSTLSALGYTFASHDWAPQIVSTINSQFHAGKIRDLATGEQVAAWQGHSNIAYVTGTGSVRLRWRKGQPFGPWILVELVAVAVVGYFIYETLRGANWSLSKAVSNITNPTAPGIGQVDLFGIPVWGWLVGGTAAMLIPFGEEREAIWERAHRALTGRR